MDSADLVAVEFTFAVPPQCQPGGKLQVRAPDGSVLVIPVPRNASPNDNLVMKRTDDGRWEISHLSRPDSLPPQQSSQPSARGPSSGAVAKEDPWKWRPQDVLRQDLADPSQGVTVRLETTQGNIMLRIVRKWAPIGADRFLELVDRRFFDSRIAIYRAVPDFLVQFGVVKGGFGLDTIEDDAHYGVPVEAGSVVFAAAGPNSRRHTLCIFLNSFPQLGRTSAQVPIGKVADNDSMEVLSKLYTGYGDIPQTGGSGPDPLVLEEQGNFYINTRFPKCDFIHSASRVKEDEDEACTIA